MEVCSIGLRTDIQRGYRNYGLDIPASAIEDPRLISLKICIEWPRVAFFLTAIRMVWKFKGNISTIEMWRRKLAKEYSAIGIHNIYQLLHTIRSYNSRVVRKLLKFMYLQTSRYPNSLKSIMLNLSGKSHPILPSSSRPKMLNLPTYHIQMIVIAYHHYFPHFSFQNYQYFSSPYSLHFLPL